MVEKKSETRESKSINDSTAKVTGVGRIFFYAKNLKKRINGTAKM